MPNRSLFAASLKTTRLALTTRPVKLIRLMVNVLPAEGCNDLLTDKGKITTVLEGKFIC